MGREEDLWYVFFWYKSLFETGVKPDQSIKLMKKYDFFEKNMSFAREEC